MDTIKKFISDAFWNYTPVVVLAAGSVWSVVEIGKCVSTHLYTRRMLNTWKDSPKDIVIVHAIGRGKTVPNNSPFVLKLETYLRMANIPYRIDNTYPHGPKGKTPWITLNGQHYTDSQLIIEFLSMKYDKIIGHYTAEQRAYGRAVRIMMDEFTGFGFALWRYVHDDGQNLHKTFALPPRTLQAFRKAARKRVLTNAWGQGIGRHTETEVIIMTKENLRAVSLILGSKKFLLGDEPSEDDCAVFGMLAQGLWSNPGCPYERLMNEELTNLRDYCIRMKETFWPDWEKCLAVKH